MLALPPAPSWYPGHMAAFAKTLPSLLQRTHIVLEVRDARLPLTSINPQLEDALSAWRGNARGGGKVCERIVVYTKGDLVPAWGLLVGCPFLYSPVGVMSIWNLNWVMIVAFAESPREALRPSNAFRSALRTADHTRPPPNNRMSVHLSLPTFPSGTF